MNEEVKAASVQRKLSKKDLKKIRELGRGAYSKVFLAADNFKDQLYAIKRIKIAYMLEKEKLHQLKREREILTNTSHPSIIKLHFTFTHKDKLYFALEYVPNGELAKLLKACGALPLKLAQHYAAEIVNALQYLKLMNIAHRDIKPENILLDEDFHLKITDFGTAKFMDKLPDEYEQQENNEVSFVGSPEYVSPEVLKGWKSGPASDLWALGCMIYKFLVGKSPFYHETAYLIFQDIIATNYTLPSNMNEAAKDICRQLLVFDPAKRLGNGPNGFQELKAHPFFKGIDFNNLLKERPPIESSVTILEMLDKSKKDCRDNPEYSDEEDNSKSKSCLEEKFTIIKQGTVLKKCGWVFYRNRDLVLNERLRLVYFSTRTKKYRGDVILTERMRAVKKGGNSFYLVTPKRTYYFKGKSKKDADEWVEAINGAIRKINC